METLSLLEEVLGAKFKFEKLSKQFGCYDGSKFGFYEKVTGLRSAYCLLIRGKAKKNCRSFFSLVSVEYRLFYFIAKGLVEWLGLVLRVDG